MLEITGFSKAFGNVVVLDGVDFSLAPGEVHALLGENGAGKSTLINLIIGTFPRSAGRMRFHGRDIAALDPHTSREMGIAAVFQEFSLAPDLTVTENLFLGREDRRGTFLRRAAMRAAARALLDELGFHLDLDAWVRDLSRAQKQMVEIAKALRTGCEVLILDEPTASLTDGEAQKLFEAIARLKARGVGIVYVSHRMSEIRTLSDRVTVLRGGCKVGTIRTAEVTDTQLIEMMVGLPMGKIFPVINATPGPERLRLSHLTTASGSVRDASLTLHAGEVLGLAGLVGCGRSELCRAIFGLEPLAGGEIILGGRHVTHTSPSRMLHHRVCYLPGDRGAEGLAAIRPVRENVTMATLDEPAIASGPFLRYWDEPRVVRTPLEDLGLNPMEPERRVVSFSGGNQQKVMLARGLMRPFDIYLFDEPTVGIDVNAKADVYQLIKRLVENGAAVILSSSELPELLHMSSRIHVMSAGRIVADIAGPETTEAAILSHYFSPMSSPRSTTQDTRPRSSVLHLGDPARSRRLAATFLANGGIVMTLLVMAIVATALAEPRFLNQQNLVNLGRNFAFLLIPALAQMLVMTARGFDLSVGIVAATGSVVCALAMGAVTAAGGSAGAAVALALVAVVGVGLATGLVNAVLVARFALSPFMVTLAMMSALTGIALYQTQGIPIYGVAEGFVTGVGRGGILGIPVSLVIALAVLAICVVVQRFTVLGRHIYAVGSDARAARLSGVPVVRVLVTVYVLAAVMCAFTGFLMAARIASGQATIAGTLALESIAAAVIGGVSLRGGVGRAGLVAMAALFLTVIANAMNLLQLDSKYQTLVLGVVLILALGMERVLLRSKDR